MKVGAFPNSDTMKTVLVAIARAGAQGVCGINSVKQLVLDTAGRPVFGVGREYAGVSGAAIRPLALSFVRQVSRFLQEEKLSLKLIAMGGVTQSHHFQEFLDTGADLALSATGVMWNPYIAMDFHREKNEQSRSTSAIACV